MHNFKRAFKLALAHRVNVVACMISATVVALLWGGNLTAVYPVVEVIMNDHALPDWIDQKIDDANQQVEDSKEWLSRLEKLQGENATDVHKSLTAEIERRQVEL